MAAKKESFKEEDLDYICNYFSKQIATNSLDIDENAIIELNNSILSYKEENNINTLIETLDEVLTSKIRSRLKTAIRVKNDAKKKKPDENKINFNSIDDKRLYDRLNKFYNKEDLILYVMNTNQHSTFTQIQHHISSFGESRFHIDYIDQQDIELSYEESIIKDCS